MGLLKSIVKDLTKPLVNNVKGKVGEIKVDNQLNPLLFGKVEHRQINNLILVDDMGKSHQIDHIEIRENGIFCIETKNYKGWIFGSENQQNWTQTLFNEKHQFLNPIKQNKSHIYHLSQALGGKYKINSIIVFAQNNADKVDVPYVINLSDLKSYLKKFDNGVHYSIEEMDEIYTLIQEAQIKMSNRIHVENIHKTQDEIKEGICPRCGAKLVERKGKSGTFIGCSNYPNCKYTMKK